MDGTGGTGGIGSTSGETPVGGAPDGLSGSIVCGDASFFDDFDGSELDRRWADTGTSPAALDNGRAVLPVPAAAAEFSRLTWQTPFSLKDCEVHVALPRVLEPDVDGATSFIAMNGLGDFVSANITRGGLDFYGYENDQALPQASIPYDPTSHLFVRLREAQARLYFETSADAATWTTHLSEASPAFLNAVQIEIVASLFSPSPEPQRAEVDHLNASP